MVGKTREAVAKVVRGTRIFEQVISSQVAPRNQLLLSLAPLSVLSTRALVAGDTCFACSAGTYSAMPGITRTDAVTDENYSTSLVTRTRTHARARNKCTYTSFTRRFGLGEERSALLYREW